MNHPTHPVARASSGYDRLLGETGDKGYFVPAVKRRYGPIASRWRRLLALIVDGLILALIDVLIDMQGLHILPWDEVLEYGSTINFFPERVMMGTVISALVYFCYMLYFNQKGGQTPGKRLLNIRVVREDGTSLDFRTNLWRTFAVWFPFNLPLLLVFVQLPKIALLTIMVIGVLFSVLDYCALAFANDKKQSLHDGIVGTIVVND